VGFMADELGAEREGGFVQSELIDLEFAADDGFAEAEVGIDQEFGETTGDGIDGEGHAGDFAWDHLLDDDRHGGLLMGEMELGAIGNGAVSEEREVAGFDGVEDAGLADAVEEGLVLAGEGGEGEILESGGRADGEGLIGREVGQGFAEFGGENGGQRDLREIDAERSGFRSQGGGVVEREAGECGEEIGSGGDELAEGLGAEDEAARNEKARLGEFGEVGAFAAAFDGLGGERIAEVEEVGHESLSR